MGIHDVFEIYNVLNCFELELNSLMIVRQKNSIKTNLKHIYYQLNSPLGGDLSLKRFVL